MGYADSELWKLFEKCAIKEKKTSLVEAVKQVCDEGEALAGTINQFFPNFTLHNEKHIQNVCNWMVKLLRKEKKKASIRELAMLVMSACCHDIGMAVNDKQEESLRKLAISEVDQSWKRFFNKHRKFYLEFKTTGDVSAEMLRGYVRENHPSRVAEQLKNWSAALTSERLLKSDLLELCKSHGFDLSTIDSSSHSVDPDLDLTFCAILLRLADILDYDASRAPKRLLEFKGLDNPMTEEDKTSTNEWIKNGSGSFHLKDGALFYSAEFTSPGIEHDINGYLNWVDEELKVCRGYLSRHVTKWNGFDLPTMVTRKTSSMGYETGDFRLTMDQDGVLELLSGESLYDKPGVFVRELLQNAIDAVLTRAQLDSTFSEKDGRIDVRTWYDPKDYRYAWFSITDNGIGMDKHAIESYFLKVGRSYYCSDEYKSDIVACGGDSTALPISRFGIGILSCFMSSSHNQLEVVTRRYSQGMNSNPVYRLDVTGLHGYYVLSQLDATHHGLVSIRDEAINKPFSPAQDSIHGVGTTVYVKVDLFSCGRTNVFRQLLDKYICFPRVRVTFNIGESDEHIYATQDELMTKVHALNPDGREKPLKQYRHPFPDEAYKTLRELLPEFEWKTKPDLVIRYHPLDWYTDSKELNGVIITIEPDYGQKYDKQIAGRRGGSFTVQYTATCYEATRIGDIKETSDVFLHIDAYAMSGNFVIRSSNIYRGPLSDFISSSDIKEKDFLDIFVSSRRDRVAFEGIALLQNSNGIVRSDSIIQSCLILEGSYRPEMDLARTKVTNLTFELSCDLELINQSFIQRNKIEAISSSSYIAQCNNELVSRRTCEDILYKRANWVDKLYVAGMPFHQLNEEIEKDGAVIIPIKDICLYSPTQLLSLNHLQSRFRVTVNYQGYDTELIVESRNKNNTKYLSLYLDLPPNILFFSLESTSNVACVLLEDCLLINESHPFSKWFISHSSSLRDSIPEIHSNLLQALCCPCPEMCEEGLSGNPVEVINRIIDYLKTLPGDPFEVGNLDLFSSEDALIYKLT